MNRTALNYSVSISSFSRTEQWGPLIFFLVSGFIGVIGNGLIFGLIIMYKKLHTFFYILLAGHTLGRAIYSFQYVIVGIYRIVIQYDMNRSILNRFQCHTVFFLTYFCNSFSSLTMLLIAVDRTYSLRIPKSYRKCIVKQGILVVLATVGFTVVTKIVPSYSGPALSTMVNCDAATSAVTTDWWQYNYFVNTCLVLLSVILYIVLFFVAFFRKRSLATMVIGVDARILQRQLLLLDSIRLLITVNIFTLLPFNVLQILSGYFEPSIRLQLNDIGAYFSSADRVVDPLILIWQSSDIRFCFRSLFSKSSSIAPGTWRLVRRALRVATESDKAVRIQLNNFNFELVALAKKCWETFLVAWFYRVLVCSNVLNVNIEMKKLYTDKIKT